MATSTHRNRHIEFWVERAAQAVVAARAAHGERAVRERVERAISREDAETTARVLRILARDLGSTPTDLEAIEQRVRDLAGMTEQGDAEDAPAPEQHAQQRDAAQQDTQQQDAAAGRPLPPTGLRSDMLPRRRGRR